MLFWLVFVPPYCLAVYAGLTGQTTHDGLVLVVLALMLIGFPFTIRAYLAFGRELLGNRRITNRVRRLLWGYAFVVLGPIGMTAYYAVHVVGPEGRVPPEAAPAIGTQTWNRLGSTLGVWTLVTGGLMASAWIVLLILHFAGVIQLADS